ncbi:zona pellucida sperm-binding protein 3d.2 [Stigmatopora argus]
MLLIKTLREFTTLLINNILRRVNMAYFPFLAFFSLFVSYQARAALFRDTLGRPPSYSIQANRFIWNNSRGERPSLSQGYFKLPVFVHSQLPPLEKKHLSPSKGSGLEPLPEPVRERLFPASFERRPPGPSEDYSVRTSCKMDKMLVRVPKNILGGGDMDFQLKLGTCQVNKSSKNYVYFLNGLEQCGTKRQLINGQMIYSNSLRYDPRMLQGPIRRMAPFVLPVACVYTRYQYSYKIGYLPKMRRRHIFKAVRNRANFILTPRNAQWERLGPSDQYTLGEPMYFEAEGPPLPEDMRLYVHTCYVTPNTSHASTPQFPVINNFGCMIESKYSHSRFIPHQNNVVRFSVDAFSFQGMTDQKLYMHCSMSVESDTPTPTAKSCNYDTNLGRWAELHGWDWVCACCDSTCGSAVSSLSEIRSGRGWKVQPTGHLFKTHKKKTLFLPTKTTRAGSVVKTTAQPLVGGGVEREEGPKGTAVVLDARHAFKEPKVQFVKNSTMMKMIIPSKSPMPTRNTSKPQVKGKTTNREREGKFSPKNSAGAQEVKEVKERQRIFEDVFKFDK